MSNKWWVNVWMPVGSISNPANYVRHNGQGYERDRLSLREAEYIANQLNLHFKYYRATISPNGPSSNFEMIWKSY